MKTRHIIISGIAGTIALFAFGSCNGRLDIPQHSVSNVDSYYQTDAEAEEGIVTCYTSLRTLESTLFSNWFHLKEYLCDDNWSAGEAHAASTFYMLSDFTFSADHDRLTTCYTNLYKLIYNANVVIEKVTGSSAVMQRAIAEAKVFRAWANFELVTLWGPAPKVDHLLAEEEYLTPNSTVAELWAFIEQDLNEAIGSGALTEKTSLDMKTYRVTKQYAQALLGKALLFQNKYSEAAAMFENVISAQVYDLPSDYSTVGTPVAAISSESLFEINHLNDNSNSSTNNNMNWVAIGLRAERFSYSDNWFGAQNTWGFLLPTKDLYDAFVSVEGEDGYRLRNSIMTQAQLAEYGATVVADQNDCEGYWNYKFRVLKSSMIGYFYACNTRIMRYAEVLLLAAEANFQAGNTESALNYINQVRSRAQAPAVGAADLTLDVIKTENRLELCFEGHRYQNLLRWGDAEAKLASNGQQYPTLTAAKNDDGSYTYDIKWTPINDADKCGWKKGKHEYLPFPATEVAVNKNLTQNPGW